MGNLLGHPLLVLAIGAVLTGLLIPRFTQRWQDQRKALEVKADLIERASRAVAEIFVASQFAHVGAASQSQEQFDQAFRTWQHEKVVLTSLLRAYFRSDQVDHSWMRCRALATAYYTQTGVQRADYEQTVRATSAYLRTVAAGLALEPPKDFSEDVVPQGDFPEPGPADIEDVMRLRAEVWRYLDLTVSALREERIRI